MKQEVVFINGLLNYLNITPRSNIDLSREDVECIIEALEFYNEYLKEEKH